MYQLKKSKKENTPNFISFERQHKLAFYDRREILTVILGGFSYAFCVIVVYRFYSCGTP